MRAVVKFVALGCLLAVIAPSLAEEVKKAKKEWEGTWECESRVVNGKKQDPKGWVLVHTGTTYTLKKGDKVISEGTSKVDPKAKPHTIDTTGSIGKYKDKTALGIYEINGDTMKLCISLSGTERPKTFASEEGSGTLLETWKRVSR